MAGASDRIFLTFGGLVLVLGLLGIFLSATPVPQPTALIIVLLATAAVEASLTLLSERLGRPAADRTIRILLLAAVTLACARLADYLHSPLWILSAMPAIAMALFWRSSRAAVASLILFVTVLVVSVLLHPGQGSGTVGVTDVMRLAFHLAFLWACILLLNLLLEAIRSHRARRQRELERSAARHVRLEAILAALSTAVLVVDRSGWIQRTNRAMEALCGRSAPQLEGLLIDAVVHLGWGDGGEPPLEREGRSEIPVDGGEPIPVAFRVLALGDGNEHLVSLQDLRSQYEALSDIAEQSELLEEHGVTQSRFLATMSHQLRTPMDAVVEEVGGLVATEPLSAKQRRYLAVVRRNADQLLQLIDDMLLICRIDGALADPTLDEVSVLRLLREASIPRSPELQAIAGDGQLPTVKVDRIWMDRIFAEILDAQPFIGGRPIRVEHAVLGQVYRLHVPSRRVDTGAGEEFVFGPHFPEHEGVSPFANTRLGLLLARLQAQALGGDLTTGTNSRGQPGFVLELPVAGVRSF